MGMREKLIELLCEAHGTATDASLFEDATYAQQLEMEADSLIDNGVTIQKWIPVTERLPEMHTKVLCCGIRGGRFIAELSTWGNGNLYWDKRNGKGCPEVTHWMPLPEPPKEVE